MTKHKHFQIRKRVVCDLINGDCTDEQDITISMTPNCKECRYYKEWKSSGLNLKTYIKDFILPFYKER